VLVNRAVSVLCGSERDVNLVTSVLSEMAWLARWQPVNRRHANGLTKAVVFAANTAQLQRDFILRNVFP
jgi:hypothetical protein